MNDVDAITNGVWDCLQDKLDQYLELQFENHIPDSEVNYSECLYLDGEVERAMEFVKEIVVEVKPSLDKKYGVDVELDDYISCVLERIN